MNLENLDGHFWAIGLFPRDPRARRSLATSASAFPKETLGKYPASPFAKIRATLFIHNEPEAGLRTRQVGYTDQRLLFWYFLFLSEWARVEDLRTLVAQRVLDSRAQISSSKKAIGCFQTFVDAVPLGFPAVIPQFLPVSNEK